MYKLVMKMGKPIEVKSLPYNVKVYINNQVLIPAMLVKALGIETADYAYIRLRYEGEEAEVRVKLLKPKNAFSRQFTIPKYVREKLNIEPESEIEILSIEPV